MKTLEAVCVSSIEIKRNKIVFDESTGLILDVLKPSSSGASVDFYFNDDCLLFAGMGDVHIHAREDVSGKNNYKEDFVSARSALRNGGLCHAGDMPNNPIPPVDDLSYKEKFKLIEKAEGELWAYAGVGPGTHPLSFPVPYKVYMGPSIGDLYFKDLPTLESTLREYRGQNVSFHCEDPVTLKNSEHLLLHHERRPVKAEVIATKDALMMIEKFNLKGKLCHFSSKEGLFFIREARQRGVEVQIEVTPQHLYFDQENLKSLDQGKFQMNPPIRFTEDRIALLEAVKNGEIDFLATDHAPHTEEEKQRGASGLTGLDTYASFVTWLILIQGVNPQTVAKMASENPGIFFNKFISSWSKLSVEFQKMGNGVGFVAPGFRANFTVINMKKNLTISREMLRTKVKHSPFEGVTFPGQLEALFIGGERI